MQPNKTPFNDNDIIRRTRYTQLYYWAKWIWNNPTKAHYIAKKKTLSEYPIKKGEPLYS